MTKPICITGLLLLSLMSCKKKDYHCECTTTAVFLSSPGNFTTETFSGANSSYGEKSSKKQAEAACKSEEKAVSSNVIKWYTRNGQRALSAGESIHTVCVIN